MFWQNCDHCVSIYVNATDHYNYYVLCCIVCLWCTSYDEFLTPHATPEIFLSKCFDCCLSIPFPFSFPAPPAAYPTFLFSLSSKETRIKVHIECFRQRTLRTCWWFELRRTECSRLLGLMEGTELNSPYHSPVRWHDAGWSRAMTLNQSKPPLRCMFDIAYISQLDLSHRSMFRVPFPTGWGSPKRALLGQVIKRPSGKV